MENNLEEIKKPKDLSIDKQIFMLNYNHLGLVLSNLAIFFSSLSIAMTLSGIIATFGVFVICALLFAFLMIATVATVGIIYLVSDFGKLWSWFGKITDNTLAITDFIYRVLPFVSAVGFVACLVSVLVLIFAKEEKKIGRIVASSILGFIMLVITLISIMGVIK